MNGLPIACELSAAEIARRADELLPGLVAQAVERRAAPGGFRWRFVDEPAVIKRIAAVIAAEHRCCRFLRFQVEVEPGEEAIWLAVTGPEGTEAFLTQLVSTWPHRRL